MGDLRSIREIAAELVANYHRKYPGKRPISGDEYNAIVDALKVTHIPAPVVEAAIRMEQLNAKDRDWLARIGIKL